MQPITAAYKTAIASDGYQIATVCRVYSGGVQQTTLPLLGGSIQISRTDQTRARCTLTVSVDDLTLLPGPQLTGLLTPFGNEIQPWAGITYKDGTQELVPLGVFAIADVEVDDTGPDVQLTLTGMDRSWVVAQRKLTAPYNVSAGTNVAAAVQALIQAVYPGVVFNIAPSSNTVPAVQFKEGDDPWYAALTIATSGGYEVFFDRGGVCVGRPIPDPLSTATSWSFAEGPGSTIRSLKRTLTREGVSNDFIVSGSGTQVQPPVRGEAADSDPNSVTYTGGPFGTVPTYVESSLVTTSGQAQNAADNLLAAAKGSIEQLDLDVVPNPAHDVDDVVSVQRNRAGVNGTYVIDTVTHTLGHGGSTALTTRRVR